MVAAVEPISTEAPAAEPDEPSESVDLILRHVSRLFPEQLALALLPPGVGVASATWHDTQVTARQRRMDRALDVRLPDGTRRLLHNEWEMRMKARTPFRVFEYHALLVLALMDELALAKLAAREAKVELPEKDAVLPRIESTLVLLSGREEAWPDEGVFRTSPDDGPFSGVTFRIEPVYQRTLAEIEAKGSRLWLIFAPLAVDATPDGVADVVRKLQQEVPRREFEELSVAMAALADADKRRRGLRGAIMGLLPEEVVVESWIYQQGVEKGVEKGVDKGIKNDLAEFFALKMKRPLSENEQAVLGRKIDLLGVTRIRAVILDLAADALAGWLADPAAT